MPRKLTEGSQSSRTIQFAGTQSVQLGSTAGGVGHEEGRGFMISFRHQGERFSLGCQEMDEVQRRLGTKVGGGNQLLTEETKGLDKVAQSQSNVLRFKSSILVEAYSRCIGQC